MRVTVSLSGEEHDKLKSIAHAERRSVHDQAAHVIARWLVDAATADEPAEGSGGGEERAPATSLEGRTDGRAS